MIKKLIAPIIFLYFAGCSQTPNIDTIINYRNSHKESITKVNEKELNKKNDTLYINGAGTFGQVKSSIIDISEKLNAKEGNLIVLERKDEKTEYFNVKEYKAKDKKTYLIPMGIDGEYHFISKKHDGAKAYIKN
jgi:hypothetical protein